MYLLHNGPITFYSKQAKIILDEGIAKASLNIYNLSKIKL